MANVTLFVPEDLKNRMDEHDEIRWSKAIRNIIEKKLDDLEEANRIASKSKITQEDVDFITKKINEDMKVHSKRLFDEVNSGR